MQPLSRQSWLTVTLVAFGLGLVYTALSRENRQTATAPLTLVEEPTPGNLAPDFSLTTAQGEEIKLSELRGQPVVLNFWASWCGPCRIETPFFQTLSETYADQLVVVGVNQRESNEAVTQFASEFGLTYPLPIDDNGRVNHTYRVFGLPTTYFIDENGVIISIAPGTITQAYLDDQIGRLLDRSVTNEE